MLKIKSYTIIIHIAGWLLFMAFPLFFLNNHGQSTDQFYLLRSPYYWLFCFTFIALFYLNTAFLIPRFFLKKKYIDYAIGLLVLLSCVYFLQPFDKLLRSSEGNIGNAMTMAPPDGLPTGFGPPPDGMPPPDGAMPPNGQHDGNRPPGAPPQGFNNGRYGPPPGGRRHIDSTSLFIFVMIMALGTAAKTIQQWQLTEQRAAHAEAGKASAELSFLKAQINPHFLFNTLNNIYTLAVMNSPDTADSIMKLSNIMRFVTDEVTEDSVTLQDEITCISDYIELQKLRIGDKNTVNFEVTGDTTGKRIAPLIFMTFVENVFKYGISKNVASVIDINIAVTDKQIYFISKNPVFNTAKIGRTGIGIKNTKQRLEHLYAHKHLLDIVEKDNQYIVQLTLQA